MQQNSLVVIFLVLVGLSSCHLGPVKDEVPVARAFDSYLYRSDLNKVIPVTASPEDSAAIAEKYINKWLHENVLIGQAQLNLSTDQLDVEEKLEQYKNSLLVYAYEQALIDEKLDTNIALLSTLNYYENNKQNFILHEPVFRLRYIKLLNNTADLNLVSSWIISDDEVDIEDLQIYCESNAAKYFLNDTIWVTPMDIKEELPNNGQVIIDNPSNGLLTLNDENFIYLINVREFLKVGEQAPIDLVKEDIRSLILNKRKLELLKKMRKDIYSEAVRKKNVELFHYEN